MIVFCCYCCWTEQEDVVIGSSSFFACLLGCDNYVLAGCWCVLLWTMMFSSSLKSSDGTDSWLRVSRRCRTPSFGWSDPPHISLYRQLTRTRDSFWYAVMSKTGDVGSFQRSHFVTAHNYHRNCLLCNRINHTNVDDTYLPYVLLWFFKKVAMSIERRAHHIRLIPMIPSTLWKKFYRS